MGAIKGMEKGAVTGMVLKDLPEDIPKMDSCPFCVLAKLWHFSYKDRRTHRPTEI